MATGLRFEDRLVGSSNYSTWRERIVVVLEENKIWEFVDKTLKTPTNATALAKHKRKDVKDKRIVLDGVKDHVVPHLSGKKTTKELREALTKLYQSDNHNRKMVLREKLKSTVMSNTDTVTSYLTKISQIRNELVAVRETILDADLVSVEICTKESEINAPGSVCLTQKGESDPH